MIQVRATRLGQAPPLAAACLIALLLGAVAGVGWAPAWGLTLALLVWVGWER